MGKIDFSARETFEKIVGNRGRTGKKWRRGRIGGVHRGAGKMPNDT